MGNGWVFVEHQWLLRHLMIFRCFSFSRGVFSGSMLIFPGVLENASASNDVLQILIICSLIRRFPDLETCKLNTIYACFLCCPTFPLVQT